MWLFFTSSKLYLTFSNYLLKTDRMLEIYITLPSNKKCGDNTISVTTFVATVIFWLDNAALRQTAIQIWFQME